ncbi:hypothetical protein FVR03_03300 [Pontibacter qinzhouensis]|uniref:Uncharacterized protein n=1 Tax=Pontibacter qinzhouensis TaxID=2603253 RepID=A0A5C8KE28_9BACT|nr:hypothetical protein [Pontibacter qinzhouensis]TXK51570.1 hypothetical protein FVR03_03300 [Pontibacter qinzhouensis]
MKNKLKLILASLFIGSSLSLASCGGTGGDSGENASMPPESLEGETRETGADITGDMPGTGTSDTLSTNATGTGTDSVGLGTTTGQ